MYGTEPGTYNLTEAPKFKNVEYDSNKEAVTHTVYYKVSKDGYNDNTGSATVKINPVEVTIKINNVSKKVGSGDPEFTAKVTGVIKGETLDYTLRRAEADKDKEHVGDVITIEADYTLTLTTMLQLQRVYSIY